MNRLIHVLSTAMAILVFLSAGQANAAVVFAPTGSLDLGLPGNLPGNDPRAAGGYSYNSLTDTYTVWGGGGDWWDDGEFGHFVYQPISGDFWFEGSVEWIGTSGSWPGNWSAMHTWVKVRKTFLLKVRL